MDDKRRTGNDMEQLNRLWTEALEVVKKLSGKHVFNLWMEPLEPISLVDGELIVETPDSFFTGWVKNHYASLILDSLQTISPEVEKITFTNRETGRKRETLSKKPEAVVKSPAEEKTEPVPREKTVSWGENLNQKYSFDNFVIGGGNELAHAAALSITRSPGKAYNPFFIHGPVGVGKTHLMQAIGSTLQENANLRVAYLSSEKFLNEYIYSLQKKNIQAFRNRFRELDLLLVDDIQFIGGKEETQKEFFHTFNALYDEHKQVVLSCDRSPDEIKDIEQRLVSRFVWGLVVDIDLPDFETRAAILRKKAETQNFSLPDDVVFCLAENIEGNIRKLEGALNRLIACAGLYGKDRVDLAFSRDILRDVFREQEKKRLLTVPYIIEQVAGHFQTKVSELTGNRRSSSLMLPRQVAIYLSRKMTDCSLPVLGNFFGGRNHSTIIYTCRKVEKKMHEDVYFKDEINRLREIIKQSLSA